MHFLSYLSRALLLLAGLLACDIRVFPASFLPTLPNGIASGDTAQTSAVLWARSTVPGNLSFAYSTNAGFENRAGFVSTNVLDSSVPVKVEITALAPGTRYYYQATDAGGNSLSGSFRTPPALGDHSGLRFGVSGDWRGELRPFMALANAAGQDLDFFVALGDTAYVDFPSPAVPSSQAKTLAEFRTKHGEVYSEWLGVDPLAELRAATSIFAVIDDHEIVNDFAGGAPPASNPDFDNAGEFINETALYRNGIRAFLEFNPIREITYDTPGQNLTHQKPKLYRFRTYGSDAALFLVDERSFRSSSLPPVTNPLDGGQIDVFNKRTFDIDPGTGASLPRRTLLSLPQLAELKTDLLIAQTNRVTWKFILVPEPIQNLGFADAPDRFEGYASERTELLKFIKDNHMENVVFISADIHGTVVNNVSYQLGPGQTNIPSGTFEITTGSTAYSKPFGPTVFDYAEQFQLFTGFTGLDLLLSTVGLTNRSQFEVLSRQEKDNVFKSILDLQLGALGYDSSGLENSGINSTLLKGGYVAVHTYGWTQFEVDRSTQTLTVTTYGIEPYSPAEVNASILDRKPEIVSQFSVPASLEPERGPTLQASRSAQGVNISWADSGHQFDLESIESLQPPITWSRVPQTPLVMGDQNVIVIEDTTRTRFYRLKKR